MNVGGLVGGIVLAIVGILVASFGGLVYTSCTATVGAPTTGSSGTGSYPSGCGATLVIVVFGIVFLLLGILVAARAYRTTTYVMRPSNMAVPPAVFRPPDVLLPPPPIAPAVRCPYCGTAVPAGAPRCPSCGARA